MNLHDFPQNLRSITRCITYNMYTMNTFCVCCVSSLEHLTGTFRSAVHFFLSLFFFYSIHCTFGTLHDFSVELPCIETKWKGNSRWRRGRASTHTFTCTQYNHTYIYTCAWMNKREYIYMYINIWCVIFSILAYGIYFSQTKPVEFCCWKHFAPGVCEYRLWENLYKRWRDARNVKMDIKVWKNKSPIEANIFFFFYIFLFGKWKEILI